MRSFYKLDESGAMRDDSDTSIHSTKAEKYETEFERRVLEK